MAPTGDDMVTLTGVEQDLASSHPIETDESGANDFTITNNTEIDAYEATIGGRTAAGLLYSTVGNRVVLLATSVLPEFRGKGVAARLIGGVLDELRTQGKTATVNCLFTAEFVNTHPEFADVLDPTHPGQHTKP